MGKTTRTRRSDGTRDTSHDAEVGRGSRRQKERSADPTSKDAVENVAAHVVIDPKRTAKKPVLAAPQQHAPAAPGLTELQSLTGALERAKDADFFALSGKMLSALQAAHALHLKDGPRPGAAVQKAFDDLGSKIYIQGNSLLSGAVEVPREQLVQALLTVAENVDLALPLERYLPRPFGNAAKLFDERLAQDVPALDAVAARQLLEQLAGVPHLAQRTVMALRERLDPVVRPTSWSEVQTRAAELARLPLFNQKLSPLQSGLLDASFIDEVPRFFAELRKLASDVAGIDIQSTNTKALTKAHEELRKAIEELHKDVGFYRDQYHVDFSFLRELEPVLTAAETMLGARLEQIAPMPLWQQAYFGDRTAPTWPRLVAEAKAATAVEEAKEATEVAARTKLLQSVTSHATFAALPEHKKLELFRAFYYGKELGFAEVESADKASAERVLGKDGLRDLLEEVRASAQRAAKQTGNDSPRAEQPRLEWIREYRLRDEVLAYQIQVGAKWSDELNSERDVWSSVWVDRDGKPFGGSDGSGN
jgi:hypothetical protein